MSSRQNGRAAQQRARIAHEAARVMLEGGIRDYQLAKRKAVERLRLAAGGALPGNDEIEAARREYQRLFRAGSQPQRLAELRETAIQAMRLLAPFRPRLVGPVLDGTADEHSHVTLHVFAENVEELDVFLLDRGIRYETGQCRMRMAPEVFERLPTFELFAGDVPVEIVVFAGRGRRHPPLSPVDGKPMQRASIARVMALEDGAA